MLDHRGQGSTVYTGSFIDSTAPSNCDGSHLRHQSLHPDHCDGSGHHVTHSHRLPDWQSWILAFTCRHTGRAISLSTRQNDVLHTLFIHLNANAILSNKYVW